MLIQRPVNAAMQWGWSGACCVQRRARRLRTVLYDRRQCYGRAVHVGAGTERRIQRHSFKRAPRWTLHGGVARRDVWWPRHRKQRSTQGSPSSSARVCRAGLVRSKQTCTLTDWCLCATPCLQIDHPASPSRSAYSERTPPFACTGEQRYHQRLPIGSARWLLWAGDSVRRLPRWGDQHVGRCAHVGAG